MYKYLSIICNKYNKTKVYIQVYEYMYKYLSNYSISIFNFFITSLFSFIVSSVFFSNDMLYLSGKLSM